MRPRASHTNREKLAREKDGQEKIGADVHPQDLDVGTLAGSTIWTKLVSGSATGAYCPPGPFHAPTDVMSSLARAMSRSPLLTPARLRRLSCSCSRGPWRAA